jgi:transcriptional regulator with XRE-family HTH domain
MREKSLGEQIQELIKESGKSRYQIAKEAGIRESTLQRVAKRDWGKQLDTAEKILKVLGKKINIS